MPEPYVLAMDAGGTRTRCVVASLDGTVLARAEGTAANVASDREGAARALRQTARQALCEAGVDGPAAAACAGVAGYTALAEGHPEALFATVSEAHRWMVYPDLRIAWAGGTAGRPGIVVIGGTGSVAFGRNAAGQEHRCGGWGYLLDDEGSGFWIGRRALQAALRYLDGRGPETTLVARIAEAIGAEGPRAIVQYSYQENRSTAEFARLAPLVTEASGAGDAVARGILEQAGRCLAEIGATTIRALSLQDGTFPVVTVGGTYRSGDPLLSAFRAGIAAAAPGAVVGPPRYVPVAGALILALEAAGAPPDDAALRRLDAALAADLA